MVLFLSDQLSMIRATLLSDPGAAASEGSAGSGCDGTGGAAAGHVLHFDSSDTATSLRYTSRTVATLQVVANPILNRKTSPVASALFRNLRELNADLVRYVPWFPYPLVGVAELDPPDATSRTTSWNFTAELRQQFMDTYRAVVAGPDDATAAAPPAPPDVRPDPGLRTGWHPPRHGHQRSDSISPPLPASSNRVVINFSTQPTWMFNTTDWSYDPSSPNKAVWNYPRGSWADRTTQLVGAYYGRLVSWIVHGSFEDEFGNIVSGGPALGLGPNGGVTHWEVFNEPEAEHRLNWVEYNRLYDSVVRSIRASADPDRQITFVGLALSGHYEWDWYEGFLTLDNHVEDVRDAVAGGMVSFHWYGSLPSRTNVSQFDVPFSQLQHFLDTEIPRIIDVRDRLSPTTGLFLDEAGVIAKGDNNPDAPPLPPIYYNMVAGLYTVLVSELSTRGIDAVASSQFCGCPPIPEWDIPNSQFPGVSMTNWTTGNGNPRYWALKLYLQYFGPGDTIFLNATRLVSSSATSDVQVGNPIYVQARLTAKGNNYAVILVNKTDRRQTLTLKADDGFVEAQVSVVDETTHDEKWKEFTVPISDCCSKKHTLVLEPFAVAVLNLIQSPQSPSVQHAFGGDAVDTT